MGDDWDGHRGERDDDDQQIEAGPEESFGQSLREGHDMDVFDELRYSKEGEVQNRDLYQGRKITPMGTERPLYTPEGRGTPHLSSGHWHLPYAVHLKTGLGLYCQCKRRHLQDVHGPWTRALATITTSSSERRGNPVNWGGNNTRNGGQHMNKVSHRVEPGSSETAGSRGTTRVGADGAWTLFYSPTHECHKRLLTISVL